MPFKKGKVKLHWSPPSLARNICFVLCKRERDRVREKGRLLVFSSCGGVDLCKEEAEMENKRGWQCGLAPAVNLPQSQMAGPWSLGCDGLALNAGGNPCLWAEEAGKEKAGAVAASTATSHCLSSVQTEAWVFTGEGRFGEGLSQFDSAVVPSTTESL